MDTRPIENRPSGELETETQFDEGGARLPNCVVLSLAIKVRS